ncbi:BSD domain-containing protein 1 [Ananas comosus]|uniref:BSD domain-containing protein 1 n=1 Tax=Ananas comosus TaxID=4615 RepID=A0A199VAE7_ANACO|nr:BSD domain-containing protein 1 [Ananas comosus]
MNFFKSIIFSDDADPPSPSEEEEEEEKEKDEDEDEEDDDGGAPDPQASAEESSSSEGPNPNPSGWSLGGLIKDLASKSESVIRTYRRDLEEFGSGIRKESTAIRDVAGGALDAGASVAQEKLETVGQAIDDLGGAVWRGTAEIIAHGKEALRSIDLPDPDPNSDPDPDPDPEPSSSDPSPLSRPQRRPYSRFEAQLLAAQSDPGTFLEEPGDAEDFERWRSEFVMADKEEEIEMLCYENAALEGIHEKLVPETMDRDAFWSRYFYKVHKLKQAEEARTKLVSRAISGGHDEDLSWDVDDDGDGEEDVKEETVKKEEEEEVQELEPKGCKEKEEGEVTKKEVVLNSESVEEKVPGEASQPESFKDSEESADKERPSMAGKAENAESNGEKDEEMKTETADSCKNSDFSVISSQPSMPEDDLGWDEIEDLGEQDEKKPVASSSSSPPKVDLRKRLSAAADDEDLSWDIEEDDEPTKP